MKEQQPKQNINNDRIGKIQPGIQAELERYMLLKRQGKTPIIGEFIKQYPTENQQILQEEIQLSEQLSLLFRALKKYQAEKFASELSEKDIDEAYVKFKAGLKQKTPMDK